MGLMSSIRKSFFSCQMVDITLSDSCFFAIATPCLCLFTEGRSHCTCVLPHSLALIFSPASLTVCNFFFSFYRSLILLGAYFEQTLDHSLGWSRDSFTSSSKLSFSPFPLFVFLHLNCWTFALAFFFLNNVLQLKRGNQSTLSLVFSVIDFQLFYSF